MRQLTLGIDEETGLVHYDSRAKHTYVWPLCSTPYLNLRPARVNNRVVTCVECLANYVKYCGSDDAG